MYYCVKVDWNSSELKIYLYWSNLNLQLSPSVKTSGEGYKIIKKIMCLNVILSYNGLAPVQDLFYNSSSQEL